MGSVFPYGAVYFRKSNPPAEDWARDHATAARVGMNTFRHWFLWSAIEVAPGKFDWADYDTMMDLAAANGLKVDYRGVHDMRTGVGISKVRELRGIPRATDRLQTARSARVPRQADFPACAWTTWKRRLRRRDF